MSPDKAPQHPDARAVNWHALTAEAALQQLDSRHSGLSAAEVEARLDRYGANALPAPQPPGIGTIFLRQFLSPLIYILLVAAAISLLIGELSDAGFITVVVVLNALLGTWQENKAERSAANLQRLLQARARVRRDGRETGLAAAELVPGDMVLLASGDRIPADLRLCTALNLSLDESLLTGESQAVAKGTDAVAADRELAERTCLAFAGTTVMAGRGRGVVVATGLQTEVGRIAAAVTRTALSKPPLVIRMERFARQISLVMVGFIVLLAVVAILEGSSLTEVFFIGVALAVAAIPEGLPVAMTVALAIATSRMAKRHVIVRRLTAVEGLGSCTCIASDKTGTLTINRQTAHLVWLPGGDTFSLGIDDDRFENVAAGGSGRQGDLLRLATAAVLCNEARVEADANGRRCHGDAIDVALLELAGRLGLDPEAVRRTRALTAEIPYESAEQYAAAFFHDGQAAGVAVKGAVEKLLPRCTRMQTAAGARPTDTESVAVEALRLSRLGYRVLAVADGVDPAAPAGFDGLPPLCLLGLVGFVDPLRPEARQAIATCRNAGVRVVMVTGDHPATALALAGELDLAASESEMLTGRQLEALDDSERRERIAAARVFARVTPLQKVQIVEALVAAGHFVAVTGDGVNDAPALRQAHIGVAMGSGTDVARDTASIIVTDDNFASVVAGVEEGRFAYANIRKVVFLLIATGGGELVLFLLALLFGLPLPLLAAQLLWLNLVTNGIQDVALACEAGEAGQMQLPPRSPDEGLFNRSMIRQVLLSGGVMGVLAFGLWQVLLLQGCSLEMARNLVLLEMVLLENVHVFNCRSERLSAFAVPLRRNPLLIGGLLTAQGLHIAALYTPLMQQVLGVMPVTLGQWLALLGLALILLLVMELYKHLQARNVVR